MGILTWILFGLLAGFIAKWIMPRRDRGGFIMTMLLGTAGALVGGFVGVALGFGDAIAFDLRAMGLAIAGTLLLLVWGFQLKRRED
ncbi:MAG: GlsB/YeaQ/YmgE family stress response membrane protein [Rhodobacterales bacterium]|nr:GlsB/YeaQ/YmgE family stress response membrane protein [Rhodobacterales bacterium]